MSTDEGVTRTLGAARNRMYFDGWTQGTFARDSEGAPVALFVDAWSFCIMGAIDYVADSEEEANAAIRALEAHIAPQSLVDWNDTPGRTKDDVMKLIYEVING